MAKIGYTRKAETIINAICIDEYVRSLTQVSREIKEEDDKRRALMRSKVKRTMREELEDVNMLGSILSPYEVVRR